MYHFLPVHHFGMACLAGSKVNIQHMYLSFFSLSFSLPCDQPGRQSSLFLLIFFYTFVKWWFFTRVWVRDFPHISRTWRKSPVLQVPFPDSIFSNLLSFSLLISFFYWNLRDSESPRLNRTPPSILDVLGLVGRVFANGPWDRGSIPGRVIPKTLKLVLDTSLLNTEQYKVRIKGSNPGKGVAPFPAPRCRSYWKGSLLVALDYSHQLYLLLI